MIPSAMAYGAIPMIRAGFPWAALSVSDIAFNPGAQGDCFSPADALRDICLTAVASAGSIGGLPPFAEPVATQSYRYWGASDCVVWKPQPESCPD
jgi:hypothetical protein